MEDVAPRPAIERVVARVTEEVVVAVPALQRIVAGQSLQGVVAGQAIDDVVACSADDGVGKLRRPAARDEHGTHAQRDVAEDDVLDVADRHVLASQRAHQTDQPAAGLRDGVAGTRADEDEPVVATAAVDGVDACAWPEGVVAVAAPEHVVARSAVERVIEGAADQGVSECRAQHLLKQAEVVAAIGARGGTKADRHQQLDAHATAGMFIAHQIDAAAAVERVVAQPAFDAVIAVAAFDGVGHAAAHQGVVRRCAEHAFDVEQGVVAALAVVGDDPLTEVDRHRPAGDVEAQDVEAAAAVDGVVAARAIEELGDERAVAAQQRVAVGAAAHLVDVDEELVACAGGGAGGQVDRHRAASAEDDAVGVRREKRLRHRATVERVVSVQQVELLESRGRAAHDAVVLIRRREEREVDDGVDAIGALVDGARADPAVAEDARQVHVDADCEFAVTQEIAVGAAEAGLIGDDAAVEAVVALAANHTVGVLVAEDCVVAIAAAQRVVAQAALQQVVAGLAVEAVIARQTLQRVVQCRAVERVVVGGADEQSHGESSCEWVVTH